MIGQSYVYVGPKTGQPLSTADRAFFLSGLAALIYQVCWQRLLFSTFGVDIESITIIVSTFMLGLGAGALVGGQLADRFPEKFIQLFAIVEFGIGLFGLLSPTLIREVGRLAIEAPLPVMAAANFLLLLIPTLLMGATLPMLVAFLVRSTGNVGVSIGGLYCPRSRGLLSAISLEWVSAISGMRSRVAR